MTYLDSATERLAPTPVEINMDAEDAVLADVDSYANWLSWQCGNTKPERIGYVPRSADSFARFVETLTVPQLVALSLYPSAPIAGAASMALRERYLADLQTVEYIKRVADELECHS